MAEQVANLGYLGFKKETTKGVAVTPNIYAPIYEESLTTDVALDSDSPIIGNKFAVYKHFQGMRKHGGDITFLAEPNTAAHIVNGMMTQGSPSGSDPYTYPFTISNTTNPKSYTMDILKGQIVHRFMGVEVGELTHEFDKNKMVFKAKVSALKSFIVREISSVAAAVVTFKTNYDPTPTDGLVVSDLVRIEDVSLGTYQDFTIVSIDSAIAVTLSGSPSSIVSGDLFFLRGATPSYTLKTPFMWARTEFRFSSTDAAAALTASQIRLEQGSAWTLTHEFENEEGSQRSGAFDPAALVRTLAGASLDVKIYFDTADDMNRFLTNTKYACVVRHFSEGTSYEMRVTLNNLKFVEAPNKLASGDIIYIEGKMEAEYDASDATAFGVTVINGLSSV